MAAQEISGIVRQNFAQEKKSAIVPTFLAQNPNFSKKVPHDLLTLTCFADWAVPGLLVCYL